MVSSDVPYDTFNRKRERVESVKFVKTYVQIMLEYSTIIISDVQDLWLTERIHEGRNRREIRLPPSYCESVRDKGRGTLFFFRQNVYRNLGWWDQSYPDLRVLEGVHKR